MEKDILNGLENGKTVCFLVNANKDELINRMEEKSNLNSYSLGDEFTDLDIKRSEFSDFLKKFGIASLGYSEDGVEGVIARKENAIVSFSNKMKNGNLIFLPSNPLHFKERIESYLSTLASNLISYSNNLEKEIPHWLNGFKIGEEPRLEKRITKLQNEMDELESRMEEYGRFKTVLTRKSFELTPVVIDLLEDMGLNTYRKEQFEEDFWILNEDDEKSVICEVRSGNRNARRGDVNDLESHREKRGLDKEFPALLIINTFANAESIEDKRQAIEEDTQDHAKTNNILMMRTLDLLNLQNQVEKGITNPSNLIYLCKKESGWLRVTEEDYEIKTG